ncbi:MAG: phosphatidate cytidylyltransferase [Pseudomonadota bacterium]
MLGLPEQVFWTLVGIFVVLIIATGIVHQLERGKTGQSELRDRTRSWWFIITIFTIAMVTWHEVSTIFLGLIAFMALKEYLSLIPTRRIDRWLLLWAYLAIPLQFYWAHTGWYGMFVVFIPVWMFLFFPVAMALRGDTRGFLPAVGTISWGLMICVFAISHTAMLLGAEDVMDHAAGGAGVLLFLVVCTQFNDVAQFTWGKLCKGRYIGKIVPSVSPNKTWEGFLGGLVTTAVLAMILGPHLTAMDWRWSGIAGAVIAIAGFSGDISISAFKRDLGVKDASHLIPGHGGILDRVDSLTYSAPVFFHFYSYFYISGYPGA